MSVALGCLLISFSQASSILFITAELTVTLLLLCCSKLLIQSVTVWIQVRRSSLVICCSTKYLLSGSEMREKALEEESTPLNPIRRRQSSSFILMRQLWLFTESHFSAVPASLAHGAFHYYLSQAIGGFISCKLMQHAASKFSIFFYLFIQNSHVDAWMVCPVAMFSHSSLEACGGKREGEARGGPVWAEMALIPPVSPPPDVYLSSSSLKLL